MQKIVNIQPNAAKIISMNGRLSVFSKENIKSKKLIISMHEGVRFIYFEDIIRLESLSNYTKIYTSKGKSFLASKSLKYILEQLPTMTFLRIHKSHVINIYAVELLSKDMVHLVDQSRIPISRSHRKLVLERFGLK